MMMNQYGLLVAIALSLTACSTASEQFDCKAGKGVGCKSITEINKMVDQGQLGADESTLLSPAISPVVSSASHPFDATTPLSDDMEIHRIKEEHLRVWVAPFQDEQGNLHKGSVVHTVLKPGYWSVKES